MAQKGGKGCPKVGHQDQNRALEKAKNRPASRKNKAIKGETG